MKETKNPFLPDRVYIADGEPHVFGDRVYLFGSHDGEAADTYCALDYEFYSAPIDDLSNWTSKGINYSSSQDPLSLKTNRKYMYAPDCVRGNDGKYYLYYCLSGERGHGGYFGPISVARCDVPDGKYEFYGYVKNPDGTIHNENVCFDPAVMNDDGIIRLYYGTLYPFYGGRKNHKKHIESQINMFNKTYEQITSDDGVMGPFTTTLCDDMLTINSDVVRVLPVDRVKPPFDGHYSKKGRFGRHMYGTAFFEAASIRKFNNLYYFIYSSLNGHELCYAYSKFPNKDFKYGGVIISNGDIGYKKRHQLDRLNATGTNHGSIECINGNYYVFYHRQTHGSDYSRLAMAEPINILPDGSIPQVPMSSMSFYAKPLCEKGKYHANLACNITNGHMPHGSNKIVGNIPCIISDEHNQYVKLFDYAYANYKYFNLSNAKSIAINLRGYGPLEVYVNNILMDTINVNSKDFTCYKINISGNDSSLLTFKALDNEIHILSFELLC